MSNAYSSDWIELFLRDFETEQTSREVEFLENQLPPETFARVLDVCCGLGRHGGALSERGHDVTGIDRAPSLIADASRRFPRARFLTMDVREIAQLRGPFDAAICMWQSFGFLDTDGNERVLRDIASLLRPAGRFVLDSYHRGFFDGRVGTIDRVHRGRSVRETKSMTGDRLRVQLFYDGRSQPDDVFDWQVFTPDEVTALAARVGLTCVLACTGFDTSKPPSAEAPRMQLVFARKDR